MLRYPIDALHGLAPPAPARVGGRVVASESSRALIADPSGTIEAAFAEREPPIGAWVVVDGTWNGQRLIDARVGEIVPTRSPFPRPDGEWQRLHGSARVLANLRLRARIARRLRQWFDDRAFVEVETPLAVPSPGLDLHLAAFEVVGMREPRFLITSPEYQMKRLLAGGLTRIYQLCRCFRRDEEGDHHQPEFTMLEWYRAFAGPDEIMRDTEELVAALARDLTGSTTIAGRGRPIDVTPPWPRITVADAFARYAGVSLDEVLPDEERFFRILVDHIEPHLGIERPVFLVDWPASMASLARLKDDDPRVAERIEAYVDGLELCNGFGELIDPVEQRARLERDQAQRAANGLPVYPIDPRFLAALDEGLPRCAGNALGFDRLVMLLLGVPSIDAVIAFPQRRL